MEGDDDLNAKQRPVSDDWNQEREPAPARRPSAPAIRTHLEAPRPLTIRKRTAPPPVQTAITAGFVVHTHITPPETPLLESPNTESLQWNQALFHNYLRAMHAFDPYSTTMPNDDDSSQSAVALRSGDLVLVHCVHANGWADGTVLNSGERGWLPTNYCEGYDHPYLRNLLNAMTQFWDLLGENENANLSTFVRQDYIRGLIAGVRYLLERADCLHREAPTVKQHVGTRRMRKGLLADLSSLVQIAKRLQEMISEPFAGEVLHVLVDDLVSKACKVVTRAVGFTDVWTQETGRNDLTRATTSPRQSLQKPRQSLLMLENAPLAIDTKFSPAPSSAVDSAKCFPEPPKPELKSDDTLQRAEEETDSGNVREKPPRLSMVFTPPAGTVAHRVSLVAKDSKSAMSGPLASEQLAKVHDICISHIGAFIGHHLHSRPGSELVATTERLVKVCRNMLSIIEEVYAHDPNCSPTVLQAKTEFESKVDELANSTKSVFRFDDSADDEIIMLPDQANKLISVATSLIRNTGECVVRTRQLIEQIGDFEIKTSATASSRTGSESQEQPEPAAQQQAEEQVSSPKRISISHRMSRSMMGPPPPPLPKDDLPHNDRPDVAIASTSDIAETATPDTPTTASSLKSFQVPPARRSLLRSSQLSNHQVDSLKSPHSQRSDSTSPARKDSVGMSIAGSTETFCSSARDSSMTTVSQVSTRATTPEHAKDSASSHSDPALMNSFASISSLPSAMTDDGMDAEAQLLQKTYANELTFNKDGQVTGGSLPALVEQLSTHDSAPDPQFVTAFFLTFRKFCEPREFAQALIDRFDYIGDSRNVGTPARLRIYNIFKGWLETYWNADADKEALGEIRFFALHKLKQVLPSAGDRLIELTRRITEGYSTGTITGPLVSGLGKIAMSIGSQFSGKNGDEPDPSISSKQLNALRLATGGGSQCNIVDFEPVELARQITLLVMKTYCEIRPDELLSMEWSKASTKKAKNIRSMCLLNTDLAHMVGDTILTPEDPKKRANVIKHWVKICMACLDMNNYDSIMAIMCTLQSSVITRLKRTWDLVSKKTKARMEELNAVVDMSKNYSALRKRLETPTVPCLPFLGVYLTDLTFVIAGNPKRRELPGSASETGEVVSVINFDMHMRIAKIISHLQKFQVPYKLKAVPEMQTWLEKHWEKMREGHDDMVTSLHRRSLTVEPKEHIAERKHSLAGHMFRSDSEERPRTAMSKHGNETPTPTGIERFDFFHLKAGAFSMRSTTTLASTAEEQGRRGSQVQ